MKRIIYAVFLMACSSVLVDKSMHRSQLPLLSKQIPPQAIKSPRQPLSKTGKPDLLRPNKRGKGLPEIIHSREKSLSYKGSKAAAKPMPEKLSSSPLIRIIRAGVSRSQEGEPVFNAKELLKYISTKKQSFTTIMEALRDAEEQSPTLKSMKRSIKYLIGQYLFYQEFLHHPFIREAVATAHDFHLHFLPADTGKFLVLGMVFVSKAQKDLTMLKRELNKRGIKTKLAIAFKLPSPWGMTDFGHPVAKMVENANVIISSAESVSKNSGHLDKVILGITDVANTVNDVIKDFHPHEKAKMVKLVSTASSLVVQGALLVQHGDANLFLSLALKTAELIDTVDE